MSAKRKASDGFDILFLGVPLLFFVVSSRKKKKKKSTSTEVDPDVDEQGLAEGP